MAVLGVLVGGLIIAMYLPIFQLGAVVGGYSRRAAHGRSLHTCWNCWIPC